jgi:hypothetical protein
MFIISDRVKETSTSTGVGDIVLNGPFGAFQSFNTGIGDGNTTYYTIENNSRWEVGQGVYTASSNSISRDVVFDSSSGGAKITLEGVSTVFCTLPAARAFVEDPDGGVQVVDVVSTREGNIKDLTVDTIFVSGDSNLQGSLSINGDTVVGGDTLVSGDLSVLGDLDLNLGGDIDADEITAKFLTLIRPNSAGNFLHAYKDDGVNQTVSLWVDSNVSPLWRFGLKTNPLDQTATPTFGYIFGRDGSVGSVSDTSNYFSIANTLGFSVQHQGNLIFRASSDTGVYIDNQSALYPALTVQGAPLNISDLQRWEDSLGVTLSVIDSGGKVGILTDSPIYELDVDGSGRMDTITLTSGIYFPDGTFQSSASVGGGGGGAATFPNDLIVSLGGGKTFGRYEDGDVIPASGLTAPDVITLAVTEPIDPTVNLSSSSSVDFNQTSVSVTLNFSHTINSLGASVASASLEFRRANTGAWTVLSTSTTTPDSFVHNFTDSAFNTDQLNYRYTVTDSAGATATATFNINPDTYSAPSISFNVDAVSLTGPESDLSRERGNDESNLINGNVSRNETYVDIQTAQWQYRADGGAWQDIDAAINLPAAGGSLSTKNHLPSETTASTIQYRIEVVDDYQTTYSSTITVNFGLLIFYGPSSSVPTTSANVRALPDRLFTNGNDTFNLNTGSTEVNFTVAIPDTETISEVLDLDALNANITAEYVNNPFNVDDGGGTAIAYNVYTMTIAIPYSSNHRHQVTKG